MDYKNKLIMVLILLLAIPMMLYPQSKKDIMVLRKQQLKNDCQYRCSRTYFQADKCLPFDSARSIWESQSNAILAQWQCLGPEGGNVNDMVIHTTDPAIIYIVPATNPCLIFKTTDAGQNWNMVGKLNMAVFDLEMNPKNPSLLYAGGSDRMFYKSYNGGKSWTGYEFSTSYDWIYSVAVHPTNSNIIYAGADFWDGSTYKMAVLKTTDGGRTWQAKSFGTDYGAGYSLTINPQHPDTVFVGGYSGISPKIFRTYDGGTNWSDISTGLMGSIVNSLTIHPDTNTIVFAGTAARLYKSTNSGETWNVIGNFPTNDLAIDLNSTNTMYAASIGEIYKSIDAGVSWNSTSGATNIPVINVVLIDPTVGNNVYAGSQSGILKSINAGTDWVSSNKGFIAAPVTELQIPQAAPNVLYIAIDNDALYKSEDKGQSWTRLQEFEGCDGIIDLTVAPNNPDLVLVLSGG